MTYLQRQKLETAALGVVALVLVALVFFTRNRLTTSEAEARSTNLLKVFDEEKITRVRLERKEGSFTVVRDKTKAAEEGAWDLAEPLREDAEPFAVQKLLGTLEFATAIRKIRPEEVNRAAFGLDDPSLVVHVDMGDIRYRLRVGKEAASPRGAHYLEIAGESAPEKGVVLITKSLLDELSAKVDDFRERYVMPYLSSAVDRIVLEGAGGTRKLRRGEWRDGFRFDGMMNDARVGRLGLDRLLTQFARTRADTFLDPAVAERALAGKDTVSVTMTPLDKKHPVGVVVVGGACPGGTEGVVALRTKPDRIAACVPGTVFAGLSAPADSLVDRTLFWMRPDEVERFEIARAGKKLSLERKESAFVLREPHAADVDAEAGGARLEALLHATGVIVKAPDPSRLGLEPGDGSALVRSAAADDSKVMEETVTLSAATPEGKIYARRRHDGAVLELPREAARALSADTSLVRSRTILDFSISDVSRIAITGALHQEVDRALSGVMTLRSPSGFDVDGTLALELCDALRNLTADAWVAEEDDGSFGLDPPSLRAELEIRKKDATETHVLRIGRPAGSGWFASMEGEHGVFVVPKRLHETLTTWVVDRGVFVVDAATTSKISLSTPERTVTLEKRGTEFVQTDDGEVLPPEAVQKILDTLGALRAEAAVDLGPPRPEHGLGAPLLTVRVQRDPGHGPGGKDTVVWKVGAGDTWRGISVHYARVDGIPATYAVARSGIRALIDSL